ncbi:MAG: thiamine-phosphate kinase [bacterium]|nr:thiamine-phosphate kinase [bacterium]
MADPSPSSAKFVAEDKLIRWLRRRTADRGGRLIGDDAAVLPAGEEWAVTMDSQIEDVHFGRGLEPEAIARRLLAVNLSDLAAMGGVPVFAFLSLSAPGDFDHRRFFAALVAECEEYDLDLAGGDLTKNRQIVAVMTVMGRRPRGQRWLLRGNARFGEDLWLGGTVGEAALGLALLREGAVMKGDSLHVPESLDLSGDLLIAARRAIRRHLLPTPQLELGRWLGTQEEGAAIDLSDGIASDLNRLCQESSVGAEVEIERLPVPSDSKRLAETLGCDWRRLALAGGEDYVLLFTLPNEAEPPKRLGCVRLGRIKEGGVVLLENSESTPLLPLGWDHLAAKE